MIKSFKIDCPDCKVRINVPFIEDLKAKAIEDWDIAEISAQEELSSLQIWLMGVSLWGILKWWVRR